MGNKPKPILVIKMSVSSSLMQIHQTHKYVEEKKIEEDYHVLIIGGESKNVEIEVFYDKNIKETDIEQLKQLLNKGLKTIN